MATLITLGFKNIKYMYKNKALVFEQHFKCMCKNKIDLKD